MIRALVQDVLELASLAAFGAFILSFATAVPH
jgi:hypothetical protein